MLELYIMTKLHDCELCNDIFFDYNVSRSTKFNNIHRDLINKIDGVQLVNQFKIKSKYGGSIIPIYNLSSGCKTALNVSMYNDIIFFIGECGDNALKEIFNMKSGKICTNYFFIPPVFNNAILCHFEHLNTDVVMYNNEQLEDKLYDIYHNYNYNYRGE